jgi:uncharacterized protein
MPTTIAEIRDFLALRRIALVGVSRHPDDFSRVLFRNMTERGYDMVPVNPSAGDVDSRRCFARVQEIQPRVEGALLMTRPQDTDPVVRDCAEAGIRHVWMYRASGKGSVTPDAVAFCQKHGIHLVEGCCPLMFFPGTSFVHRVHGLLLKLTGGYPRELQVR